MRKRKPYPLQFLFAELLAVRIGRVHGFASLGRLHHCVDSSVIRETNSFPFPFPFPSSLSWMKICRWRVSGWYLAVIRLQSLYGERREESDSGFGLISPVFIFAIRGFIYDEKYNISFYFIPYKNICLSNSFWCLWEKVIFYFDVSN